MDRQTIAEFEARYNLVLPEAYIRFLLLCDGKPEEYCKGFPDIALFTLAEVAEAREYMEMKTYCPEYVAIGDGGGGEVLIMPQERNTETLIVTHGGNLISRYIKPQYCKFFYDFFSGWVSRSCPAAEIDEMYDG